MENELVEKVSYIVQDPNAWIQLIINIALSWLALFVYIVFKVWQISKQLNIRKFLNDNKPFFVWHMAASFALALVVMFVPDSLQVLLLDLGVAVKENAAFFTLGFSLASMAYGPKKREMLEQLKKAKEQLQKSKFKEETGIDPDQPLIK